MIAVNLLVEGPTDEPVARRLLKHVGLEPGTVYGKMGKAHLLERLKKYNQAAQFSPWFAIVDLDMDKPCPSEAIQIWLPQPARGMKCRIAVRAMESWLLADRENLARYLAVSPAKIQIATDNYPNPKETLINLARSSQNSAIRNDMVPRQGSGARVGPLYVARLHEFTEHHWNPAAALENSQSLSRCVKALAQLTEWE